MNTKLLMTVSSLILGLTGFFTLFTPDVVLAALDVSATEQLSVFVQLTGALYFGFALMNWTAKDSAIGGIYARPVSMGNFSHFFAGALLLIRYQFSNEMNVLIVVALIINVVFACLFYWLVFRAAGIKMGSSIGG